MSPYKYLPLNKIETETVHWLGLSASLLAGGPKSNPPHNMWTPQCPLVRGSHAVYQGPRRTMISRSTSPLLAAGAMPALGAMPGA